ncbi:zinc finger BED domain-containing protein 1-like [Rhizophagus irregularis DAOM 181602=DAOM 197198]|nr:zinc finger BED domain-containing protein 1-like [Rhizophagus irregularis DAOM 181602=DAOM 197198]
MLITIESIQYPHTAVVISKYLEKYIEEYRLENKIICVVTDNGSNMKAAVNILNQKNDKIQRLPCVAHTLQLTVINTLKSIKVQNDLNKKSQTLDNDSNDEPLENLTTNILKNINEPIIRLNATLHLEDDRSNKIDGERLQKIMLCEEEWIFLKELCKLFKPFDEMTTYFSGVEYVTISSILPIVETLKLIYKTKLKENYDTEIEDLNDINLDNITIIDDSENMKENLSDESEEENKISDDSESDETSNEPIIIRPHKHNLHKKVKKINYSDSSRKSQNISENILQKSQPESANSDQIIKRVLVTIKVACQN